MYLWWINSAKLYHSPNDPALTYFGEMSEVFSSGNTTLLCTYVDYVLLSEPYPNQWYHENSLEVFNYLKAYNYVKIDFNGYLGQKSSLYIIDCGKYRKDELLLKILGDP
jgi:hypothetical protein